MKKYELTEETKKVFGRTLYRIRAVRNFGDVHEGDLGGWIEREGNLSQEGNAWVFDDAQVSGNAWVYGDACVYGNARVYGAARVFDDAKVYGDARVYDNAWVCGNARVYDNAWVCGNAWVYGDAWVCGNAYIHSNTAILTIGPIGSRNDTTTFFNRKDGKIGVICGCFSGDIDEFAAAVQKTHGDNQFAVRYKLAIELARAAIETREEDA